MQITPSLMARTDAEVSEQLTFLKSLFTPVNILLHLDIMDGQFIPSNTPSDYSKIIDQNITFDVHLMAANPSELLDKLPQTKIRYVYCHAELELPIIEKFFSDCLERHLTPGLAINPETSISILDSFFPLSFLIPTQSCIGVGTNQGSTNNDVDSRFRGNDKLERALPATSYNLQAILLMSVVPGDSGREFDPNVVGKINQIKSEHPEIFITVDGGINRETISKISKADFAVAHNAIFKAENPKKEFELLQST
jgi:pentose-5-phosphate-3-epimerase